MGFYENVDKIFHDWNYGSPKVLYGLIRSLKPDVVCDIGTYRGYSAAWMAKACQENNKGLVYCLDNFSLTDHAARYGDAKKHLWENLEACGVDGFIRLIEGDTDKIQWPEKVDLAYVDAWHSLRLARHDFQKAASLGAKCICLDDTTQSVGPRMLMQEVRESGEWDVIDLDRDCGMGICMRREPLRPIIFSQEIEDLIPGFDLSASTKEEQDKHLVEAWKKTGEDYSRIAGMVHEGRAE